MVEAQSCRQFELDKLFRGPLAEAFSELMEQLWERGESEARTIASMLERFGVRPGSHVLEVGAGSGRVAIPLAKMGYYVTGLDYSELFTTTASRRARELGADGQTCFVVGDAYTVDSLFRGMAFDAAYMVWSTMIGYGPSTACDRRLFEALARVVKPQGLLVVANTLSYDSLVNWYRCRSGPVLTVLRGYAVAEDMEFDPAAQQLTSRWTIYRVKGRDLVYVGEARFRLRVYTLRELVELAGEAGWSLEAAYHDPGRELPYRPGESRFNLVFRLTGSRLKPS
jgi:ubiquinone/menaquinone biosynthesis C-methylase UbiE